MNLNKLLIIARISFTKNVEWSLILKIFALKSAALFSTYLTCFWFLTKYGFSFLHTPLSVTRWLDYFFTICQPFTTKQIGPTANALRQRRVNFCRILNEHSKTAKGILKNCPIGEFLPYLVTIPSKVVLTSRKAESFDCMDVTSDADKSLPNFITPIAQERNVEVHSLLLVMTLSLCCVSVWSWSSSLADGDDQCNLFQLPIKPRFDLLCQTTLILIKLFKIV